MMRIILSIILVVTLGLAVLSPLQASAFDPFGNLCTNGNASNSTVCQSDNPSGPSPLVGANGLIAKITNIIALIAGIVAVLVVIGAGLKYITSGGEPAKTQAAKNALMYALIGLAVIALARTIISFVVSNI